MIARGAQHLSNKSSLVNPVFKMLVASPQRQFRSDYNNQYKHNPTPLTEFER